MKTYTLSEEAGWLYRNIIPPAFRQRHDPFVESGKIFNAIVPGCSIAVVGDCMDMREKDILFGNRVRRLIASHDFLLANWEGTLCSKLRLGLRQKHSMRTVESLCSIFPSSQTVLSVANNHAADYSIDIFEKSVRTLEKEGFNVIGTKDRPFIDLTPDLRIIAASVWSNRPCSFISEPEDAVSYIKKGSFNLLYIHWGHEMELNPRPARVAEAAAFLSCFDAVAGHHPHLPQPVTEVMQEGIRKVAAFSLGNFFTGLSWNRYRYGLVLSIAAGRTHEGIPAAGKVQWAFTGCSDIGGRNMITEQTESIFS